MATPSPKQAGPVWTSPHVARDSMARWGHVEALRSRTSNHYRQTFRVRQALPAIWVHLIELFEHSAIHAGRFGSILKYRALHSATHDGCLVSHPAAPTQAAQSAGVCAATSHGDRPPISVRTKMAAFTILSAPAFRCPGTGERYDRNYSGGTATRPASFHPGLLFISSITAAHRPNPVPQAPRPARFPPVQPVPPEQG